MATKKSPARKKAPATKAALRGVAYRPTPDMVAQANLKNWEAVARKANRDLEGFWEAEARELEWYKPWKKVLDSSKAPFYKWFTGSRVNIVHNAIDRHLKTHRKNKLALIWESEDGKEERSYSYYKLSREVSRMASIIKSMGVHKGKRIELKQIADAALQRCPCVQNVVVLKRTGQEVYMQPERDHWHHELLETPVAQDRMATEPLEAEDPLFILYTSGSTGRPKAILHTHGGYMVGTYTTLKYVFDIKEEDRYWCAAEPGWITGHTYIVYGPLLNGATSF